MVDTDTRLDRIEFQLVEINNTLAKMAVQDEKISRLQAEISALWKKADKQAEELALCRNWQASCPRATVSWMWCVLIPMGLGILYIIAKAGV